MCAKSFGHHVGVQRGRSDPFETDSATELKPDGLGTSRPKIIIGPAQSPRGLSDHLVPVRIQHTLSGGQSIGSTTAASLANAVRSRRSRRRSLIRWSISSIRRSISSAT